MRSRVFVALALVLLAIPASLRSSELFTNINVDVKEEWFNSGIYIDAGDTLYVTGFGAFSAWDDQEVWFDMTSTGAFLADQNYPAPGYPAPAIIGRIGETQKFMAAGTVAFVSQWSGPLYFTVNDQLEAGGDNRGTVIVWLRLKHTSIATQELPPVNPGEQIRLGRCRPNPFYAETRIDFTLAASAHVTVGIYDEAGRMIRTIAEASMSAGAHSLVWDGRDAQGLQVPSGVYFYRVDLGSEVGTSQTVRVR